MCARPPDLVALQVAALQQQLMVAALTCDDVSLYNSFVITYQEDLRASDAALQAFFDRFGEEEGGPAYHAFKTKMANLYSRRSAVDKKRFCESARTSFAPALRAEKVSLASFALSQPSPINEAYTSCGATVAGGAMVARNPTGDRPLTAGTAIVAQNAAASAMGGASTVDAADKPLGVALRADSSPATPYSSATVEPASASSAEAAVAVAEANSTSSSPSPVASPNLNQQPRNATRSAQNGTGRYGSDAYRERLAQLQAQRAAQQPRARYRDPRAPYDARGYFWPADPYWHYCYTRYGVRLLCSEAAEQVRASQREANQFYYRDPYDVRGYPRR